MERIDDLQFQGLHILQDDAYACFTEDAVLLANYLRLGPKDRAIDLGCGNGLLSILGAGKTGADFCGVDIQGPLVSLAQRSADMNGQALAFYEMDVKDAPAFFGHGSFTAAVMNPPYFSGLVGKDAGSRARSRHGNKDTLNGFLTAAFLLIKNGGRLFLCWPAEDLVDILCALRAHRLEPKRMTLTGKGNKPRLALIEAAKLAGSGMLLQTAGQ